MLLSSLRISFFLSLEDNFSFSSSKLCCTWNTFCVLKFSPVRTPEPRDMTWPLHPCQQQNFRLCVWFLEVTTASIIYHTERLPSIVGLLWRHAAQSGKSKYVETGCAHTLLIPPVDAQNCAPAELHWTPASFLITTWNTLNHFSR